MTGEITATEETEAPSRPDQGGKEGGTVYNFEFRGTALEYFKIWIVNTGLSIVTLGIYSAWAKVRTNRYIYGSTFLDGSAFQYSANPIGILKGRIIAGIFFALYMLASSFFPELVPVLFLVVWPLVPWLVVKSLRFKSRYSRYRNISFHFAGTVKEAFKYWFWMYFLLLPTVGIIAPYIDYRQKKYMINRNNYGTTSFNYNGTGGDFYAIYILGGLATAGILFLATMVMMPLFLSDEMNPGNPMIPLLLTYLFILPGYLFGYTFIRISLFNSILDNTTLGDISFISTLKIGGMFWINLTNMLAIIASLGLLVPWAIIRSTRYKMEHIAITTESDLESFFASEEQNISAMGEEIGEAFDFDLSI